MSLHLIESTDVPRTTDRKRGGATASVVVHAVLVVGVFTAASAAPTPADKIIEDKLIYVAPPPVQKLAQSNASAASSAANSVRTQEFVMPRMPDLATISIDIPTVSTDIAIDMSVRDFSAARGGGAGTGNGGGGTGTTATLDPGAVLSDLQVEKTVAILSGYRTPRYPESMRAMGVEETVNAVFVVDTLGRIEAGSLEVPDAKHPQFILSVREALANARYRPAEVQGRRVRQRVMQAFVFSLAKD